MVNLIAAIGKSGQLGLNGGLPWDAPSDLALFKKLTVGGVIIVGGRTYDSLPNLPGRMVYRYSGIATPRDMITLLQAQHPGWPIWIAGGAKTYRDFAPYIDGLKIVSVIDYDGPADAWFPFDAYGMTMPNRAD